MPLEVPVIKMVFMFLCFQYRTKNGGMIVRNLVEKGNLRWQNVQIERHSLIVVSLSPKQTGFEIVVSLWKIMRSPSARIRKSIVSRWGNMLITMIANVSSGYSKMTCSQLVLSRMDHDFLHICQNPGHIKEEVLHLLADKIEAHHPHGIPDNIRKLKQ